MEVSESINEEISREQFVTNVMKQIRMFLALKYCKTDNNPSEVVPGVFIGSIGAAMSKNKLKDIGITHVLCVADSITPIFPDDFDYKTVKILDSPDVSIVSYLPECFDYINNALSNGKILVHWYELFSFAGKSRSASVCIAYLMKINNWGFDQALEYLKGKRSIVEPNAGFEQQLRLLTF